MLIEGAMGLFDGVAAPPGRSGAAADLAALSAAGAAGAGRVGPVADGRGGGARVQLHDPAVRIAGVVLNRVGSDRHRAHCARDGRTGVAGPRHRAARQRDRAAGAPSRAGAGRRARRIWPSCWSGWPISRSDARSRRHLAERGALAVEPRPGRVLPPPGQRIALASDAAFSFVYPHLLRLALRRRRDRAIFAAGRRAAARRLRRLLAAGRLSGTACRRAGQCANVPSGHAAFRGNAAGAWRVRRLHGAGDSLEDAAGVATPCPGCSAT